MVSPQAFDGMPRLVVLNGPMADQSVPLQGTALIVGRDFGTDVRFDSARLSLRHARLDLRDGHTYVSDLGSTNGTTVNAVRINSMTELHDGDVVHFADVGARYRAASSFAPPNPAGQVGDMNIGAVTADNVAVAGHDVNVFWQQRDNFLREIAASRSKATWLLVLGFFVYVAGFALFGVGLYQQANQTLRSGQSPEDFHQVNWLGQKVGGVPIGAIGFAIAFVGAVLAIIGIVLHIVAAARKRTFETTWSTEGRQRGYIH